jgi:polyisoprenoid-binding protein YceI
VFRIRYSFAEQVPHLRPKGTAMTVTTDLLTGVWNADAYHSSFEAGARHMGVGSFRTRFEDVTASLVAEDGDLRLIGEAKVESVAIRAPRAFREHVVYGEDFFDAGRFPVIRFESSEVELEGGEARVVGELTIKGVTRRVVAVGAFREPTEDPYGGVRAALDLTARIDRREFGIDWQGRLPNGGEVLSWEVDLDVRLELVRA